MPKHDLVLTKEATTVHDLVGTGWAQQENGTWENKDVGLSNFTGDEALKTYTAMKEHTRLTIEYLKRSEMTAAMRRVKNLDERARTVVKEKVEEAEEKAKNILAVAKTRAKLEYDLDLDTIGKGVAQLTETAKLLARFLRERVKEMARASKDL